MMRTILLPERLLDCKCVLCDLLFGYIPRLEQAVFHSQVVDGQETTKGSVLIDGLAANFAISFS
jgi:hypothetical protein